LGTSVHELRWLFRDNNLWAAGEDHDLVASIDPRASDPRTEREPGPVVSESVVNGVLCVRVRQCGGLAQSSEDLMRAWQNAHAQHFRHERIIVDLRANPGGDDRYMIGWIRDHVRRDVVWPAWREWRIGDVPANLWNVTVLAAADHDTGTLSTELGPARYQLGSSSRLRVGEDPDIIPAAPTPWPRRMLVLTDKGSASAAESAAWMLRTGLDAKIVGGRSAGAVGFGKGGTGAFEQHGADEQQAEVDVQGDHAPHAEHGDAFDGEQRQQDHAVDGGEPAVALRAGCAGSDLRG